MSFPGINEPADDGHEGPGRMIEIIQDDPHLDDDAERALRPMRLTGHKLPPRRK